MVNCGFCFCSRVDNTVCCHGDFSFIALCAFRQNRFYVETKLKTDLGTELKNLFISIVSDRHITALIRMFSMLYIQHRSIYLKTVHLCALMLMLCVLCFFVITFAPCLEKTKQICFCQNCVKFPPILIMFGKIAR